jgi:energy-coupling factor transporter ATP-binding protein EcfA2
MNTIPFPTLAELALELRSELEQKKFVLLYAYNGTGKTRLSMEFKDLGKHEDDRDTLYFNAYTEDLFTWDNDLERDEHRLLELNGESRFFNGFRELEMEVKIGKLLERYSDFSFYINDDRKKPRATTNDVDERLPPAVLFFRERDKDGNPIPIKISRGEENIFIWCFFLAIVQLVLDGAEAYKWVKYVYIDDPISSLDEHNAIVVANHLVQLYREAKDVQVGTVISTHHNLFFNVVHYELKSSFKGKASQYVLSKVRATDSYECRSQHGDTPSFHHVAALVELDKVARGTEIQTYHFNMLRAILEKTALFLGYTHFSACIKKDSKDADGVLHQRFIDLLSHGKYSLYEPAQMGPETKIYFQKIIREFLERYPYNKALFPEDLIPNSEIAA